LRDAVRDNPHFISQSPLGQSLVFLGDFVELFESRVAPALARGETVFTDRGWVSKYAYQFVVLQRVMSEAQAHRLLREIMAHVPKPDLTILLTSPTPVVRARLLERDGSCGPERLRFIELAAAAARDVVASCHDLTAVEVTSTQPPVAVLQEALAAVDRGLVRRC